MIITHQGKGSFKISQGELSLVVNPQSKTSADITLFTNKRSDTSDKSGFVIDGPGEYEVKNVFITGLSDKTFLIIFEGIRLCFLDPTDNQQPTTNNIENIDILFVGPKFYKSAVALEPAIIIPTNYDKASLDNFLKEGGETKVTPIDKLVVKKKDLEGKEGEIVVLKEE